MTSEVVATHVTKRGASFSEAEQVSLTHSWIEVSLDPIHGNDQKGADFYKRVSDIYKVKMGRDYTVRSPESLHAHWRDNIQCNVAKFSSAYTKATSTIISGYKPEDYIHDAQRLFIADSKNKKPFKIMKCWEILKNHEKWNPSRSTSPSETENLFIGPILERPIGYHAAKKAKVDAKVKVSAEKSMGEHVKEVVGIFSSAHRDRQESKEKNYSRIDKSEALKELKYFEKDTSEKGKALFEQLRTSYVDTYLNPPTTAPVVDITTTTIAATTEYMTPLISVPVPSVGSVPLPVPHTLNYETSVESIAQI